MKKTTSKSPKTSAKAKPAPAPVKAPAPTKPAAVSAPKVKKPTKPAPAPKAVVAPAVKAPAVEVVAETIVVAQLDIGFGNQLFIRGEGAGLNWDKGLLMDNIAADRWQIVLKGATAPLVFKVLINDETWSLGDDYVVSPGSTLAISPLF